jgi:thiol-disulfide isomerase/thioredoxin
MTKINASLKNIHNINNNIIPKKNVIIYYYSDTCPYCIMMKGLWKEISNKYKNEKNITIISLDRKIMSKLNKNLHIEMVPTIIFYKKGIKQFEFLKERNIENLTKFFDKCIK